MKFSKNITPLLPVLSGLSTPAFSAGVGGGSGAYGIENGGYKQLFATSGRHPNDTSSVTFPGLGTGVKAGNWTWRVNITNVALPGTNLTVANTEYDLQWPGGGELQSYLGSEAEDCGSNGTRCAEDPVCIHNILVENLPANLTSRYSQGDNGDCSAVLGSKCAQSALDALRSSTSCHDTIFIDVLDGCDGSLALGSVSVTQFVETLGNSSNITLRDENGGPLQSGDAVTYWTYDAVSAGNLSEYRYASGVLYMLGLTGGVSESGSDTSSSLLCQIVNTTAARSTSAGSASATTSTVWYWLSAFVACLILL